MNVKIKLTLKQMKKHSSKIYGYTMHTRCFSAIKLHQMQLQINQSFNQSINKNTYIFITPSVASESEAQISNINGCNNSVLLKQNGINNSDVFRHRSVCKIV